MAFKKLDESNIKQLKNFTLNEFKCKCGKCNPNNQPYSFQLAQLLQDIRTHFGKAMIITSPRRCPDWNKKVGGVAKSKHTYYDGKLGTVATDFYVKGVSYKQLVAYIKTITKKYNVDYYYNVSGSVMHIQIKPTEIKNFDLTRLLKKGCKGNDVKELQKVLGIKADGIFGDNTKTKVKVYQKSHGIFADGIVGKNTAHKLGWTFKGK